MSLYLFHICYQKLTPCDSQTKHFNTKFASYYLTVSLKAVHRHTLINKLRNCIERIYLDLGSLRYSWFHSRRKRQRIQNHCFCHAHGLHEIQTKRSWRTSWSRRYGGKNLILSSPIVYFTIFSTYRTENVSVSSWALTTQLYTKLTLNQELRSVMNSSPKVVMLTKSTTPLVLCLKLCLTEFSNTSSRSVTKLLTPNKRDSTSLVYWILLVSKSST